MSTVKTAESVPTVDDLLGSADEHFTTYWDVTVPELPDGESATARASIDELVGVIRRRVGDGLDGAQGDTQAAVTALRSVYREIKTQRVGDAAVGAFGS